MDKKITEQTINSTIKISTCSLNQWAMDFEGNKQSNI